MLHLCRDISASSIARNTYIGRDLRDLDIQEQLTGKYAYIVQPGDTLAGIARHYLGDVSLYPALVKANKIDNPDLISAGQILLLIPVTKHLQKLIHNNDAPLPPWILLLSQPQNPQTGTADEVSKELPTETNNNLPVAMDQRTAFQVGIEESTEISDELRTWSKTLREKLRILRIRRQSRREIKTSAQN